MEMLCDQAFESLDHTAQKEKGELAQRGKLGKRRRPSRASLKAQLASQVVKEKDEAQIISDRKLKDENANHDRDRINGDLVSTLDILQADHPVIKQGPKGTVIEIGNTRLPDAATVIRINYPMEENTIHTGAVVTGAILKSPEKRLSEMAGAVEYSNNIDETEVVESDEENEEVNYKRWKSLPSLWQAAKCKGLNREQAKEEEDAPWTHEVKLRHVEDPECAHRGCSMLFFGPLPKSQQSPTSGRRGTANSGSDSQLPDTQHNGTDVIYRPIRPRPSSVCDQVQIQTWDRRHLTSTVRTNVNDVQQKSELQRNGSASVSNLETDELLPSDAVVLRDKPVTGVIAVKKPATFKRPKKRWKLDVMEKGVQRSKSLNGIDRDDQPEWIELSKRLTSRNIDWDNLPITKNGSAGKNLQSELKLAWKIKGTQEKAESNLREDGKEEIVLRKEDLAIIPNGFTKSNKMNRWEKLDSNANISQRQNSTLSSPIQNSIDCQRNRTLPHQSSAQEETVSWIKEAEKRRRKYMDWQSQEGIKLLEEASNQKSSKVPKEIPKRHISTLPEIAPLKNIPTKLLNNEQLDLLPNTEDSVSEMKKENKIKDAVREELSLFSVKLRRVRCAKPEECFHEIKCESVSDDNQPPPEPKAIAIPTITQPPVPSPRTKKPRKVNVENTSKDIELKLTEDTTPRDAFSIRVSEQESDNFFIVINDQDDDSFLQIKPPQDIKFNKLSSNGSSTNVSSTLDQSDINDMFWPVTPSKDENERNLSSVTSSINKSYETNVSLNSLPINEQRENISITHLPNDRLDSNHIAIETPIGSRQDLMSDNDNYAEIETMFGNLGCDNQPESIADVNLNEHTKNGIEIKKEIYGLVNGDVIKDASPLTNYISPIPDSGVSLINSEDAECLYGKIHKIPNGIISHQNNNYLNLNGNRDNRKQETAEEKAARMTSEICGVLSSLGNRKTEAEKLALHMDILTTLTCPNAINPKNSSSRTMTFVTCNGDGSTPSQICGPQSVGVQTNGLDIHETKTAEKSQKKSQTRIKKKTVKIIIHECDDDDEKQEVVEEIVEEILEPRSQKGRMVKNPTTISRTIAEAEDGSTYLTTTVMDNCVFRPEDAT